MTPLVLSALVLAAPLPVKEEAPKGPAPQVILISVQGDGTPVISQTRTSHQPVKRVVLAQEGNKVVPREETVLVPVTHTIVLALDGPGVQVYGTDGKKIDTKAIRALVKGPTAALLSADGQLVDPFYLRLAKEGTLILVLSPVDRPPPAPPADAPPAPPKLPRQR